MEPDKTSSEEEGKIVMRWSIPRSQIPPTSALYSMLYSAFGDSTGKINIDSEPGSGASIDHLVQYLREGVYPPVKYLEVFEYLGLNARNDYKVAIFQENFMRQHMYEAQYATHPMNTNPQYGLIKLTQEMWDSIVVHQPTNPNLLFRDIPLIKRSWSEVQTSLAELRKVVIEPNTMVAGGRILSALFGTTSSDVDIFFYNTEMGDAEDKILRIMSNLGYTQEDLDRRREAEHFYRYVGLYQDYTPMVRSIYDTLEAQYEYIREPADHVYHTIAPEDPIYLQQLKAAEQEAIKRSHEMGFIINGRKASFNEMWELRLDTTFKRNMVISRSQNSFTFGPNQIILRLYRSPSEILHGFDVDCCCVGYDGKDIWLTQRALYSFSTGTNTFNFDRMSPSYEWRMSKYGARGFAISIDKFNRTRINVSAMEHRKNRFTKYPGSSGYRGLHHNVKEYSSDRFSDREFQENDTDGPLRGIDVLLYLEYLNLTSRSPEWTREAITKYSHKVSDYGSNPYALKNMRTTLIELLILINGWIKAHPDHSSKLGYDLSFFENRLILIEGLYHARPRSGDEVTYDWAGLTVPNILSTNTIGEIGWVNPIRIHVDHSPLLYNMIQEILHINPDVYKSLGTIRPWTVPMNIEWKITNPGEQMTGTFHKTVLANPDVWYKGKYYQ